MDKFDEKARDVMADFANLFDYPEGFADGFARALRDVDREARERSVKILHQVRCSHTAFGNLDDFVVNAAARILAGELHELEANNPTVSACREDTPNPMDTAPRDGTRILVYFKRHGWLSVAWTESASGSEIWCCNDFKFGPYAIRGYSETDCLGWLPLPAGVRAAISAHLTAPPER